MFEESEDSIVECIVGVASHHVMGACNICVLSMRDHIEKLSCTGLRHHPAAAAADQNGWKFESNCCAFHAPHGSIYVSRLTGHLKKESGSQCQ